MARDYGQYIEAQSVLALAASSLAEFFLLDGLWSDAHRLFWELGTYGPTPLVLASQAKLGVSLISYFINNSKVTEAEAIYRELARFRDAESFLVEKAMAAFYLLSALAADSTAARRYYDECLDLAPHLIVSGQAALTLVGAKDPNRPRSKAVRPTLVLVANDSPSVIKARDERREALINILAKATVNMLASYVMADQLDKATEVFGNFAKYGLGDEQGYLSRARSDLIFALAKAGRWAEAEALYDVLVAEAADWSKNYQAKAAANLVVARVQNQAWPEARAKLRELANFGSPERAREEKSRAAIALIEGYLGANLYDEAFALYLELKILGQGFSLNVRAQVAGVLMRGFVRKWRLDLARKVYDSYGQFRSLKGFPVEFAEASLALVEGYAQTDRVNEALVVFENVTGLTSPATAEMALIKARSYFSMITALAMAGRLDEALAIYEGFVSLPSIREVEKEKSKILVNLISCLGSAGRLTEAGALFREFPGLKATRWVLDNQALAAFNLAFDYANQGLIDRALKLWNFLDHLGRGETILVLKAEAAAAIVLGAAKVGRLKTAGWVYESMLSQKRPEGFLTERLRAASAIVNAASRAVLGADKFRYGELSDQEKLELAKGVFESLEGELLEGQDLEEWARALVNLVTALEAEGNLADADKVYAALTLFERTSAILGELAKAAFNRITFRVEAGQFEAALGLLADLERFAKHEEVKPRLAQAMVNVVSSLCQAACFSKAKDIYNRAESLGVTGKMPAYRAKILYNLALGHYKAGFLREAASLFLEFQKGQHLEELYPRLIEVAVELIIDLNAAKLTPLAKKLHKHMATLLASTWLAQDWIPFSTLQKDPEGARARAERLARLGQNHSQSPPQAGADDAQVAALGTSKTLAELAANN
jgi:tetratricopeptide (TPR) repeat protein